MNVRIDKPRKKASDLAFEITDYSVIDVGEVFDNIVFAHFGIKLNEREREWFAFNGKELGGSVEGDEKCGATIVQAPLTATCKRLLRPTISVKKDSDALITLNQNDLAS